MPQNYLGFDIEPIAIGDFGMHRHNSPHRRRRTVQGRRDTTRRTLGIRDKQILYNRAKKRCENPVCRKKLEFSEMQVGHKTAASKGGSATLKNSVCLCYRCNKLQRTDSWATFMKKQGVSKTRTVTSGKKRNSTKKNTRSVTSGKKKSPTKKKSKRRTSSGNYWFYPITGREKKIQPLFLL